ncbi:hypothetical protein FS837_001734 [Tulasnella sp. UAMH 9824]|nr:hypothetical protein FS837_001734 [Tulasnella sp. UAMH 9824]
MSQGTHDSIKSDSALILESSPSPLKVPELLASILNNLALGEQVSAARVCRTWSELAFDRIWRSMGSLVPLFILIGKMHKGTDEEWDFSESIQDADWSRYAVYAPRIRNITHIEMFLSSGPSNQAFQAVVDYIPPHLELPRPRSILTLTNSTTAETPQEVPMISQSLRDLTVSQVRLSHDQLEVDCSHYIRAILKAAAMLPHPSLETLSMGCYGSDAALLEAFSACLTKHSSTLSDLTATFPFDDQVWAVIFSLPNLRALDMAPLTTNAPAPSEEILARIRTLVERHPLLKRLKLELSLPPEEPLYPQLIRSLMGLRGLETLELRVTAPLLLSEAQVMEMGASWPKIRRLQLSTSVIWSEVGWEIEPRTDLSLLPSFLRHIPPLEELCIPLACKQTIVTPSAEQVPVSALQILDVGNSSAPEASQEAVVAYLAAVLPHGALIHDWSFGPVRSFWKRVAIDLAAIRKPEQPSDSEDDTTP